MAVLRDVTLADGISLFEAAEQLRACYDEEKLTLQYQPLHGVVEKIRDTAGWRPSQHSSLAVSVDPRSSGQQRFLSALLKSPFEPDPVDFRELYPSLPPGRQPSDATSKPVGTFASRLSYVLGRLSRHTDPHVLVISHCFELYWPLANIRLHHPKARVGIAYFSSLLDIRWQQQLSAANCPVEFFPLDEHIEAVFGIRPDRLSASPSSRLGKEVRGLNQY